MTSLPITPPKARVDVAPKSAGPPTNGGSGSGFAALLTTLFLKNPSLLGAFQSAGNGAAYGLFVGWIIGLATLGGYRGKS